MNLLKKIPKVDKFISKKEFETMSKKLLTKISKRVLEDGVSSGIDSRICSKV